jgi:hypothetical protein
MRIAFSTQNYARNGKAIKLKSNKTNEKTHATGAGMRNVTFTPPDQVVTVNLESYKT